MTMVQFNELRILPDNKSLVIDVAVKDIDLYTNVYLDSVIIDNQDTFTNNGPSSNPIYFYEVPEGFNKIYSLPEIDGCGPILVDEDKEYCLTSDLGNTKHLRLELSSKDIDYNNLLFVHVTVKGTPSPETPCGMDNKTTVGVVFDTQSTFNRGMQYIKELNKECSIPKGFMDFILRFKALELSLLTGNYIQAIDFWKRFFKDKPKEKPNNCGRC